MIEQAKTSFSDLKKACAEAEGMADAVGAKCFGLSIEDKGRFILLMESLVERIDALRKVLNRNLSPTRLAMAKQLIGKSEEEIELHGHVFKVSAKCHYSAPPKKKCPQEYEELIAWLIANKAGQAIEEESKITIGGQDLSDMCRGMMEEGERLPPRVREYNEISIKTREVKQ